MQCEKLNDYGRLVKKNIEIGKWLFIVAMAVMVIGVLLFAFGLKSLCVLVAGIAIFGILLESASVFVDKADEYKECIRERIISIVLECMQVICKNGALYSIYWEHRDNLVIFGVTDSKEQNRVKEMLNDVISNAIKQTGLKLKFEINLKSKENIDGVSKT